MHAPGGANKLTYVNLCMNKLNANIDAVLNFLFHSGKITSGILIVTTYSYTESKFYIHMDFLLLLMFALLLFAQVFM